MSRSGKNYSGVSPGRRSPSSAGSVAPGRLRFRVPPRESLRQVLRAFLPSLSARTTVPASISRYFVVGPTGGRRSCLSSVVNSTPLDEWTRGESSLLLTKSRCPLSGSGRSTTGVPRRRRSTPAGGRFKRSWGPDGLYGRPAVPPSGLIPMKVEKRVRGRESGLTGDQGPRGSRRLSVPLRTRYHPVDQGRPSPVSEVVDLCHR